MKKPKLTVLMPVYNDEKISQISDSDFKKRIEKTYIESKKYTQHNFSKSFKKALLSVLVEKKLINKTY